MELIVRLNGTDKNPYLIMGLTQNPFPQIAKMELAGAMDQLNSLDGYPIRDAADIRRRLSGWSEEFINLCIQKWRPGEYVEFVAVWGHV